MATTTTLVYVDKIMMRELMKNGYEAQVILIFFLISPTMISMRGLYGTYRVSRIINRGPNFVRLHIGHLIEANIVAWYDF